MKWLRARFSSSGKFLIAALISADLLALGLILVLVAIRH